MGNKKSKPKSKQKPKSKPESSNMTKGKMYMDDPVFGRMVYNEIVGAWVPAYSENMYEDSFNQYNTEKEKNKKYLKTFDIKPEKINNFSEDIHQTLSIIKKIPIKLDIYSYAYFLNDGRLAINWGNKLVIYNENYETIEQEIKEDSTHITQ